MENNEKKIENKENEKTIELSDEKMNEAVGGTDVYWSTYDEDPSYWNYRDKVFCERYGKRVNPPKWPCPKCGSNEVSNYDPGAFYQIRVFCKKCGFLGCRDGSNPYGR